MIIKRIKATAVTVPLAEEMVTSHGRRKAYSRTIVEIDTDVGITGLGEVFGSVSADIINRRFAGRLVGFHPAEIETMRRLCTPQWRDYGTAARPNDHIAFSAIDIALWDIAGKFAGLPLYRLLGGAVRSKAPFVAYSYVTDIDKVGASEADVPRLTAQRAVELVQETGASIFELKIGLFPVDIDIETILTIRDALGPHVDIAVDPNMRFGELAATRFLEGVRAAKLENCEEPVADFSVMSRLRSSFSVSMSTHCTDINLVRAYPEINSVVGDLNIAGGITPTLKEAAIFASHGKNYWLRSTRELGISWAAMCHVGMICPEMTRPSQALIHYMADDLVEGEPWLVRNGGVVPPDRPGLGVELDRAALDHYAGQFKKEGDSTNYVGST